MPSTPLNSSTFSSATKTLPPMIATRPRVCMVVCMSRRVSLGMGWPASSSVGTASTVIASATTSCTT